MVRSPGFGSNPVHLIALFRLAFTVAPPTGLTLRTKLTRWIVLQKARRHRTSRLRLLVGTKFQDLFHSPPGVLFTFPSRYLFTIGHQVVFSLGRWSSRIPTRFHVPRGTRGLPRGQRYFEYRAITVSGRPFHTVLLYFCHPISGPHNPHEHAHGFGLFRVRSPLLAESHLFSFPEGTEMFHFPSFAFYNLCIQL